MNTAGQAFETALSGWLARQAAAEERLTSFAFREAQPAVSIEPPTSHEAIRDWILGVVADPKVGAALRGLGDSGRSMADLSAEGLLGLHPGDRVALAARIGVLAAGGLVTRELESDRVAITELGKAALALADAGTPVPVVTGASRG